VTGQDDGRFVVFDLEGVEAKPVDGDARQLFCRERLATARFAVGVAAGYLGRVIGWIGARPAAKHQVVRHRLAAAAVEVAAGRAVAEKLAGTNDPQAAATYCAAAISAATEAARLTEVCHAGHSMLAAELDQLRVLAATEPHPERPVLPPVATACGDTNVRDIGDGDVRDIVATLGEPGDLAAELALVERLAMTLPAGLCARLVTHRQVVTGYLAGTRWHADLCSGAALAAIAVTEPHGGSTLEALTTTVRPGGSGFVLNGVKTLVAGAADADLLVVAAVLERQPPSTVLLVVDAGRPEVRRTTLDVPAWRGVGFATVEFNDYPVGPDDLIRTSSNGPAGARELHNGLVRERLVLAAQQLGFARRWLDEVDDGRLRLRFAAAQALLTQSRLDMVDASMAKLACCAVAADVAGARQAATAQHIDDLAGARAALFAAGTPDVNLEIVATGLLDVAPGGETE
jgi:alkylation response protein AidB-like acyl-CoA dehydrogenase